LRLSAERASTPYRRGRRDFGDCLWEKRIDAGIPSVLSTIPQTGFPAFHSASMALITVGFITVGFDAGRRFPSHRRTPSPGGNCVDNDTTGIQIGTGTVAPASFPVRFQLPKSSITLVEMNL